MTFEHRLRDRFSAASESLPGRALDWSETYARARRGRRVYLATVASGTAVVLAVGAFGARAMLDGSDGNTEPIPPAHTGPPPQPTQSPTPSPTKEPEPGVDASYEAPFQAVDDFIQAAAKGDPETVWSLLTEPSKAVYDHDFESFRDSEFSGIAEGWGSWAVATEVTRQWQVLSSSGDGIVGVVTLMGARAPEGHQEPYAAAALPVRVTREGGAKVEAFVTEGLIEFVTPRDLTSEQPPTLDALTTFRPAFEALVPGAAGSVDTVAAPVPDEPAVSISGVAKLQDAGGDRLRALWSPEERFFSGQWFLTVVATYEDGSLQAASVRFVIE